MGTLYLIATPIGNIEDITLRAKRILSEADLIACEDTRKTGLLLSRLGLPKKPLLSFYEENEAGRLPEVIRRLQMGEKVALGSNAGTPVIADPGFKLVRACLVIGIKVTAIPGPSALLTALVASGLPPDKFIFLGYLPKSQTKRQKILASFGTLPLPATLVFYESPYRLQKTLADVQAVFGDVTIAVGQELTKMFEETKRGKVSEIIKDFSATPPRGEFTVAVWPVLPS